MADEYVTIRIKVNADDRDLKSVNRQLVAMGVNSKLTSNQTSNAFQKMDGKLKKVTSALAGFNKLALKVFGGTLIIGAASLASVNLLFATGRVLVQAYRMAMQGAAVGVAAVGAALATLAASQREYNAALYAYSYKSSPSLGKGLNQSRAAFRMLTSDVRLAAFGTEALNASFASLSKSGQVTGATVGALRGLADFAAAGGDPSKNLQAAAEFLALLKKEGKVTEEVVTAAGQVNTVFADALTKAKKKGITSYKGLMESISSGQLAALGGVTGQAALVGGTLTGQFKTFKTLIVSTFADIGQQMLGPVNEAMQKIFRIIRMDVMRIAPDLVRFGNGTLLNGLVKALTKVSNFFVDLFRKHIGNASGMVDKFRSFWQKTLFVFNRIVRTLRPLLEGGRQIMKMFGPTFSGLFAKIGQIITTLNKVIIKNKEEWQKFADAVTSAVKLAGDFIIMMIEVFDRALPALTPIVEVFISMSRAIMGAVAAFSKLSKYTALISMFGLMMLGMKFKGGKGGGGAGGLGGGMTAAGGTSSPIQGMMMMGTSTAGGRGYGANRRDAYRQYRGIGATRREAAQFATQDHARPKGQMGFGPGMALGLLSTMVGKEAQGGVGLGAGLATMAPMLGKAGPAAAGIGTAIAGYSIAKNARTSKGGAFGGAMGGAAAGAMIGSVVPVIGTATGAVVGAIAGGIIGAFKGRSNRNKIAVDKAVQESMAGLYSSVASAMIKGDTKSARSDIENKLAEAKTQTGNYGKELTKAAEATKKYLDGPLNRYDQMMSILTKSTGKTEEEVRKLADSVGLNLYDDTIQFTDALTQLGIGIVKTKEQIIGASRDIALSSLSVFDEAITKLNAPQLYLESIDNYRELLKSGSATEQDLLGMVKTFGEQLMIEFPDDPLAAVQELFDQLRSPEGLMYQKGQAFAGFGPEMAAMLEPFFIKIDKKSRTEAATELSTGISDQLLATRGLQVDQKALETSLAGLSLQDLNKVTKAFASGNLLTQYGMPGQKPVDFLTYLSSQLGVNMAGITKPVTVGTKDPGTLLAEETNMRNEFFSTVTAAMGTQPVWMNSFPSWWGQTTGGTPTTRPTTGRYGAPTGGTTTTTPTVGTGRYGAPIAPTPTSVPVPSPTGKYGAPKGGDTTSSRLSLTMARHASMNNMITGKRSVTSSFRTDNLGSLNSDHVTGRAYDLTGQNLGAYSSLVNNSGGFAEFHGAGGSRHLHVVPGTNAPMGDTATTVRTSGGRGATNVTNSYSINVNGGTDSAEVIARKVMNEIKRQQRSSEERR